MSMIMMKAGCFILKTLLVKNFKLGAKPFKLDKKNFFFLQKVVGKRVRVNCDDSF